MMVQSSINRISFGSCNNQNLTNPLWEIITNRNPDVFLWAGDAIYADRFTGNDWSSFPPKQKHQSGTPESIRHDYQKQKSVPSYKEFLRKTNVTVLGTFDDHDYGQNNGDERFRYKKESAIAFMDFIGEAVKDGLMYQRAQEGRGVYGVKVFDFDRDDGDYLLTDVEAGLDADLPNHSIKKKDESRQPPSERKVAVFMLDVRSNKTPWNEGLQSWVPNYSGDFLGEKQWEWFEQSIQRSDASINIIVNGLQVHSYRFMSSNSAELWSNFPTSRQRLYDTILHKNVLSPIIISGDVHMAQFLRKDCRKTHQISENDAQSRPIVEFTTSGMTHSWGTCAACTESFHISPWKYILCNTIGQSVMTLYHKIMPMPDLLVAKKDGNDNNTEEFFVNGGAENANIGRQYSLQLNFGELEIDWSRRLVKLRAIGKDANAPPLLSASYSFDQLTGHQTIPGRTNLKAFMKHDYLNYFMDGNLTNGKYTCVNNRGSVHPVQVVFGLIGVTTYMVSIIALPHIIVILGIRKFLGRLKKT